jgi:hypothetical protein
MPQTRSQNLKASRTKPLAARLENAANGFLSEDFAFCEDALAAGFPTFILPQCKTFHAGSAVYPMDLSKVTAVAAAVVREQSQMHAAQSA